MFCSRYDRVGMLEVDGTEIIEGESPGLLTQLNTEAKFYLGNTTHTHTYTHIYLHIFYLLSLCLAYSCLIVGREL